MYAVKFKKNFFTTNLAKRKDSTNLTWLKIATAIDPRFNPLGLTIVLARQAHFFPYMCKRDSNYSIDFDLTSLSVVHH